MASESSAYSYLPTYVYGGNACGTRENPAKSLRLGSTLPVTARDRIINILSYSNRSITSYK